MGQGSTQTVVTEITDSFKSLPLCLFLIQIQLIQLFLIHLKALGVQCCASTGRGSYQGPSEELRAFRVLGVVDKVSLLEICDAAFLTGHQSAFHLKSTHSLLSVFLCICY